MQIENIDFQVKTLLLSFAITVVISLVIIPILKRLKIGQIEREEGPQTHYGKQGTPTMGGIIIILSTIVVTAGMYIYYYKTDMEISTNMLPLILASIGFGLVGFVDDFKKVILRNTKGLSPRSKMLGLLIISVAYTLCLTKILNIGTDIYIPIFKEFIIIPIWLYIPAAIFVILATTNAINLTDGIDGLGAGVSTIIITCLTIIGIILEVKEVAVFGSIIIGCGLGFLLFNLNPAKIFMGDTGSLLLGGVIASIALYLKIPLIIPIIALIPVIETISVMLQIWYFKRTGTRIFKMAPIHHHFELCGWKENKIVSIFCLITLLLCIVGLNII